MSRTKRFTGMILGITLLAILAWGTSAGAQEENRTVQLTPSRDSGVSGTATFQDTGSGVEVDLSIQGAPEGGVEHLAHIHNGATCQDDRNDQGGPVEFPLDPITTNDDGTGSSTTTIEGTTVAQLFDGSEKRYVNVHDKAGGSGVPPGIACADLTQTARGGSTTGGRESTSPLPSSGGISPAAGLTAGAALVLGAIVGFLVLRRTNI
jgi:hypothetical protein